MEYLKKWQVIVGLCLGLTVLIPKSRNFVFDLVDVAHASEMKQEITYRDTLAKIQLECLKTQNKLLEIITDKITVIDSSYKAFLLDSLKENFEMLKRQIQIMDSAYALPPLK